MIKAIPLNFVPPQLYLTVFLQKLNRKQNRKTDFNPKSQTFSKKS